MTWGQSYKGQQPGRRGKRNVPQDFPVVQRLRVRDHLPMQGRGFDPRSGKFPHDAGQLSPCPTATGPELWSPRAATTGPTCLQPTLQDKRSQHSEKPVPRD